MGDKKLIIGITGAFGSGKTTAADFFASFGFSKVSLVAFLEEEAKKRGIKNATRKILQDIGNQWREKYGASILAKKASRFFDKKGKFVIEGIRNLSEIEEFKRGGNLILIGIVANRKIRFGRLARLKRREKLTWELFEKLDKRDFGIGEGRTGLQVAFCLASSDIFIVNNKDLNSFRGELENLIKTL